MKRSSFLITGILFVAIGVFLLLDRIDIVLFRWNLFLPLIAVILGIKMWISAADTKPGRGAFAGTLLFVLGVFYFLKNSGAFDTVFYSASYFPIFPTATGLAFLSLFIVNIHRWWTLFPALFFLMIGCVSFLVTLRHLDEYFLHELVYWIHDAVFVIIDYFPVIMVAAGLLLIIISMRKTHKEMQETE